ncbi:MAG: hypothetical protein LBJ00_10570 [Planctomycetaceae bacterium]|nr:hypothetical protein [Planctomycetaceae bacterium]
MVFADACRHVCCVIFSVYNPVCSSCFKIPEATVNLQRRALGKRNNVKRLFKGEAYRPYRLRYTRGEWYLK